MLYIEILHSEFKKYLRGLFQREHSSFGNLTSQVKNFVGSGRKKN